MRSTHIGPTKGRAGGTACGAEKTRGGYLARNAVMCHPDLFVFSWPFKRALPSAPELLLRVFFRYAHWKAKMPGSLSEAGAT